MSSKRIAIIANSCWNIYNFRLGLIKRLKKEGYQIFVLAPVDEYIQYLDKIYFIKHIDLKSLNPQSRNPLNDARLVLEFRKIFKRVQPDLILNYTIKPNIFANIAAATLGIHSISTLTGLGYTFTSKNYIQSFIKRLYKFALRNSFVTVFHNRDDRKLFLKQKITTENRSCVIPGSGVNIDFFKPINKEPSRKFIYLFVGRLLEDKGIIEFVEAARQLRRTAPHAECWVVGQINAKNPAAINQSRLQQWIEDRSIRYFGTVKDIRSYLAHADVFVLPSYREGMPRAVLEAMSCAKPIITTDVPGCRDTVEDDKNGRIIPAKDAFALGEAMLQLYHTPDETLKEMGKYSRQLAESKYSESMIIDAYLSIIRNYFNASSHGSAKERSEVL